MKKLVLGAAAAAALMAPAVANAETNAVVGIDYSHIDFDSLGDGNLYGLNGAFNHDFSNGWQIQMDGATDRLDPGFCCISANYAAVHYGVRTDQYSYAGFVGTEGVSISGIDIGVEGQMHFTNASIGGSVSYIDFNDIDINAWNAHADGMWFFTPNFSINGGVGYVNADFGGSSSDYWTWNLGGEYRFNDSPFSVSLGYRQADTDGPTVSAWTIGLTLDLGTGTLQDRRVHGPSWGGGRSLFDDFGGTSLVFT